MLRYKLRERIADKEFAERRRVTIQEVAAETGIARNTLSRMINSHGVSIRSENLDRLCAFFGCQIEALVEYVPDARLPETPIAETSVTGARKKPANVRSKRAHGKAG